MRLLDALKLVPDAVRMPADFQETGLASQQIEKIIQDHCCVIEQMSIDEWYLDLKTVVGGDPHDLMAWGRDIQAKILRETALSVSVGIGPSKLLAKMAGEYRKPAGVTVVIKAPGGEGMSLEVMLRDRPAAAIPGIGRRRMPHVEAKKWKTAWDIAMAPTEDLVKLCGRPGAEMQRELLGESLFPVETESAPPKSVSRARSFQPTTDRDFLWAHVLRHAEYVILKMRRHGLACRGVTVWLRHDSSNDYLHAGATASLPQPAQTESAILPYVQKCFERHYRPRTRYTQIGIALWNLAPAGASQYSLFEAPLKTDHDEEIQRTLDLLHERFGRNSITRASALQVKSGTKIGFEMSTYQ